MNRRAFFTLTAAAVAATLVPAKAYATGKVGTYCGPVFPQECRYPNLGPILEPMSAEDLREALSAIKDGRQWWLTMTRR